MKKNLNEQISRIREMMNLNEDRVDLDTYDSNEDIIKNISIKEKTTGGNVLISMDMSMFIPTTKSEGLKHTLRVITEWDSSMRIVDLKRAFLTDAEPNNNDITISWHAILFSLKRQIFKAGLSVEDVMHNIYAPYRQHISDKRNSDNIRAIDQSVHEVILAHKRSVRKLEKMLNSAFASNVDNTQQAEPEVAPEVQDEPEKEIKQNNMWTSTSSWASE